MEENKVEVFVNSSATTSHAIHVIVETTSGVRNNIIIIESEVVTISYNDMEYSSDKDGKRKIQVLLDTLLNIENLELALGNDASAADIFSRICARFNVAFYRYCDRRTYRSLEFNGGNIQYDGQTDEYDYLPDGKGSLMCRYEDNIMVMTGCFNRGLLSGRNCSVTINGIEIIRDNFVFGKPLKPTDKFISDQSYYTYTLPGVAAFIVANIMVINDGITTAIFSINGFTIKIYASVYLMRIGGKELCTAEMYQVSRGLWCVTSEDCKQCTAYRRLPYKTDQGTFTHTVSSNPSCAATMYEITYRDCRVVKAIKYVQDTGVGYRYELGSSERQVLGLSGMKTERIENVDDCFTLKDIPSECKLRMDVIHTVDKTNP
jgi:hypothetical protein